MTDYYFWLGAESDSVALYRELQSSLDRWDMVGGYYITESQEEQQNDR